MDPRAGLDFVGKRKVPCLWRESNLTYPITNRIETGLEVIKWIHLVQDIKSRTVLNATIKCRVPKLLGFLD
jgi:hypothetical protein